MANTQNLIKNEDLTPSQRREKARKAGKASAKKRKERKQLKDELLILLSEGETQKKMSLSLIEQATKGNTKAFEIIRDTIGERPKEQIEHSGNLNNPFSELSTEELRQLIKDE